VALSIAAQTQGNWWFSGRFPKPVCAGQSCRRRRRPGTFRSRRRFANLAGRINARHSLPDKHLNLSQFRDNLFRLVSLRSHLRSSVFRPMRVDDFIGGRSIAPTFNLDHSGGPDHRCWAAGIHV